MALDKSGRRMTLRQLLTHTEKCARDMIELLQTSVLQQVSDFRDLSRPVRRKSNYPTMVAVQNALKKLLNTTEELQTGGSYLLEQLETIREHAKRERANRL
jgi:hypothetical protein